MSKRCSRAALLLLGVAILQGQAAPDPETARVNPAFTPPDTSLFYEGREVYERNCTICHGARGDGQGEMAAELGVKPRSFRTGDFKYRSTPWGKLPTTDDLIRTIRQGVTGTTTMGAFKQLTPAETRVVAEYGGRARHPAGAFGLAQSGSIILQPMRSQQPVRRLVLAHEFS